jgi:DNA end-binding protein Ku
MPASVWKGFLSFGLVSFPVRLVAAARPETIHFHMLHRKDNSRVKEVWYCAEENKRIERSEMVKGFEYAKGRYVVLEDTELRKTAPPTASVMEILQFVKTEEIDPIFFETSYYVVPEAGGERPCMLLLNAMRESGYEAVGKVAMHGREHVVAIRPGEDGMVLHTLYYLNELHKLGKNEKTPAKKPSAGEKELARKLIETMAGPFKPEQYKDQYRVNLEKLIEARRKNRDITPISQPKAEPVVDIMDALRRSLAGSRTAAVAKSKSAKKRTTKAA